MNHVMLSEFADQKISALKAEAAAVRLARSARGSRNALRSRQKSLRPAVLWAPPS
jgi:hypothetical protein